MRTFDDYLEMATTMHRGCACPGQVLGTRMALLGCCLLGMEPPDQEKRLFVFVEMDRCFADAVAAVSGCRLGKRTLKHLDYGKAACTFYDDRTGRAVRILARDDARDRVMLYAEPGMGKYEAQVHAYRVMPDEELFSVQEVLVQLPAEDRPGRPISRVTCSRCGEGVNDRREVVHNGQVLCRACAHGAYYRPFPFPSPTSLGKRRLHLRIPATPPRTSGTCPSWLPGPPATPQVSPNVETSPPFDGLSRRSLTLLPEENGVAVAHHA